MTTMQQGGICKVWMGFFHRGVTRAFGPGGVVQCGGALGWGACPIHVPHEPAVSGVFPGVNCSVSLQNWSHLFPARLSAHYVPSLGVLSPNVKEVERIKNHICEVETILISAEVDCYLYDSHILVVKSSQAMDVGPPL